MNEQLKQKLVQLANKYETKEFLKDDPAQFMHFYQNELDKEVVAFIAANLAFGKRSQILKHIQIILDQAKDSPSNWVLSGQYKKMFTLEEKSFYRMFSYKTMRLFFDTLQTILLQEKSLASYVKKTYTSTYNKNDFCAANIISSSFDKSCKIICHGKTSAAKRINLFLRWMVRDNSPVDLGLWSSWYDKKLLLIPLDTHVMQQAFKLNLVRPTANGNMPTASLKTAKELTFAMAQVFPNDPARADFALFGLGVNKDIAF